MQNSVLHIACDILKFAYFLSSAAGLSTSAAVEEGIFGTSLGCV